MGLTNRLRHRRSRMSSGAAYDAGHPGRFSFRRIGPPGVYVTAANGMGMATYYCAGSLCNVYRTTGTSDFAILCS